MPLAGDLPEELQHRIINACFKRTIPDEVATELHTTMHAPFTFFEESDYPDVRQESGPLGAFLNSSQVLG
jgi:hypothetical protein